MSRNKRQWNEGGWTAAECIASIALVAVGLTLSYSVLISGRSLGKRIEAAELRTTTAERLMEGTLAMSFEDVVSRPVSLPPEHVGGRPGWNARVDVTALGPSLKSIEIVVNGGGESSRLATVIARREPHDEALMAQRR